ncbi:rCG36704, partial [Rattus norvegicus]
MPSQPPKDEKKIQQTTNIHGQTQRKLALAGADVGSWRTEKRKHHQNKLLVGSLRGQPCQAPDSHLCAADVL